MSTLNTLKLVTSVKPEQMPDVVKRRYKLGNKLWEQIQMARCQFLNEPFNITKMKTVKNIDTGLNETIAVTKRIRPWWFNSSTGSLCVTIKYGTKVIELAKGKPSIELPNQEELISTLELVKKAVEAGELDQQIDQASGALRSNFKK
jgi:hypothetical protein